MMPPLVVLSHYSTSNPVVSGHQLLVVVVNLEMVVRNRKTTLVIAVTHVVIGYTPAAPTQSLGHFGEAFCFNKMVKREWREHGAVSMHITLDKEGSATDTIEADKFSRVTTGVCR